MNQDQSSPANPPAPVRVPYYEEMSNRATAFCQELLLAVPELASVVIIPSWKIPSDRLPLGIIQGQATINEMSPNLQLAQQIHLMLTAQNNRIGALLNSYDALAGQFAATIKQRQQELAALEWKINAATAASSDDGSGNGGQTEAGDQQPSS
jgi:hypothetical protein